MGGLPNTISQLPEATVNNHPLLFPVCILASRLLDVRGHKLKQVLVQWSNSQPEDATWENFNEFCKLYKQLNLEDKAVFEEEGSDNNVTWDIDSAMVKKQMEEWTAKGLVVLEKAQRKKEVQNTSKAHNIYSPANIKEAETNPRAGKKEDEDISAKKVTEVSRTRRKPFWANHGVRMIARRKSPSCRNQFLILHFVIFVIFLFGYFGNPFPMGNYINNLYSILDFYMRNRRFLLILEFGTDSKCSSPVNTTILLL